MLDLLGTCFPDRIAGWESELKKLIPTYGAPLSPNKAHAGKVMKQTAAELQIA
jgi:malate dehydrogenase (quinone)